MRNVILIMIILFSLLAVGIASLIIAGVAFSGSSAIGVIGGADGPTSIFVARRSGSNQTLLVDKTFEPDGIETVSLDLSSDRVDILPSPDGNFRVVQYGINLSEDRVIRAEQSGSLLSISRSPSQLRIFQFGPFHSESFVALYLPDGYQQDLSLHLTSGTIAIQRELSLEDLEIRLSSGQIQSDSEISARDARLQVTSGTLRLQDLIAETFDLGISSGNISLESISGSGSIRATSGTLRLGTVRIDDSLDIRLSSGNVNLTLAEHSGIEFEGQVSSGAIHTEFEKYYKGERQKESFATIGDGPYKKLIVQVTSGNVRIDGPGVQ